MDARLTSVAAGLSHLLLSLLILWFDGPRVVAASTDMHPASAAQAARNETPRFHATATIEDAGKGKRLTLRLEFDDSKVHSEDEGE
jgi:hypothetical protein